MRRWKEKYVPTIPRGEAKRWSFCQRNEKKEAGRKGGSTLQMYWKCSDGKERKKCGSRERETVEHVGCRVVNWGRKGAVKLDEREQKISGVESSG